jgi:hypothetical protein
MFANQQLLMESCPRCATNNPLEIVYGAPSREMFDSALAGIIALGGGLVDDSSPAFRCRRPECDTVWGRWRDLLD